MSDELILSDMADGSDRSNQTVETESPSAFILRAVWRSRFLVTLAVMGGMGVGLLLASIKPNEYQSIGKLFVRPGVSEALTPEMAVMGRDTGRTFRNVEALDNELEILRTPTLYRKVVEDLGAAVILEPYDPSANDGPNTSWAVRLLHEFQAGWFGGDWESGELALSPEELDVLAAALVAQNVVFEPAGTSVVVNVAYFANSPRKAQQVVDAVLRAALDVHREAFATSTSFSALSAELDRAEERAADAEQKLDRFRREHGIYDLDFQRDALMREILALEIQIDADAAELIGQTAEKEHIDRGLEEALAAASTTDAGIVRNPQYASLQTEKRRLQLLVFEQNALLATGDRSRYNENKAQLKELLAQVDRELAIWRSNPELDERVVALDLELHQSLLATAGLEKRREARTETRDRMNAKLVALEELAVPLFGVEREALQANDAVDRLSTRLESLARIQRLDQLNITNLNIVSPGDYSPMKIGPNRGKFIILGAALSSILAMFAAAARLFLDPRVRHRVELAKLDVPLHDVFGRRAVTQRIQSRLPSGLQKTFRDVQTELAELWPRLPVDRQAQEGLRIGFVTDILSRDATVVAGIAALGMAALGGQSVCYVSCQDAPWLLNRLKREAAPGWTDVIRETIGLDEALQQVPDVPNLKILPMGQIDGVAHPLTERGFEAMLRALADSFRYVVVDAPSFAERPESRVLLQFVDAGVVVLRSGRSTLAGAGEMVHAVRDAGANASGIVLLRASATY